MPVYSLILLVHLWILGRAAETVLVNSNIINQTAIVQVITVPN